MLALEKETSTALCLGMLSVLGSVSASGLHLETSTELRLAQSGTSTAPCLDLCLVQPSARESVTSTAPCLAQPSVLESETSTELCLAQPSALESV